MRNFRPIRLTARAVLGQLFARLPLESPATLPRIARQETEGLRRGHFRSILDWQGSRADRREDCLGR
jgi:hypothetical protein